MNIGLKAFQEEAVDDIVSELAYAKKELRTRESSQAVVLSSPTGSGKTVITTASIERILEGSDEIPNEREAVFLWVSDSPELNEQSRRKVLSTSDRLRPNDVVVINNTFDQEYFDEGKLYFINTQKLGRDKILSSKGDLRTNTIWETIGNTQKKLNDKFYLVIDEAHRGMNRNSSEQETIIQKFLFGDSNLGLPPINIILGISATPERFRGILNQSVGIHRRLQRDVNINPAKVRDSGLLKEKIIIYHPEQHHSSDWSLLAESTRQWLMMRDEWDKYTKSQKIQSVSPAMIIQVEDRDDNNITKTDLAKVINTIEKEVGNINDDEIAHCFEEDVNIPVEDRKIKKIEASKIQEESNVKFIFFKMSLTTGWDCPRAEVMMSFRKAQDHTLIAQLIGRMVRTPSAKFIEGNDVLNTVSLYLPHYSTEGIKEVIEYLRTDEDTGVSDIEDGNELALFTPTKGFNKYQKILDQLPNYEIENIRKSSNVRRLMKLSTLMSTIHGSTYGFDENILRDSKEIIINTIHEAKEKLAQNDPSFAEQLNYSDEITVKPITVEQGIWEEIHGDSINVELTSENITELFNRSGRRLGNGLHEEYWSKFSNSEDYDRVKVELFLTLQQESIFNQLEKVCGKQVEELFRKYQITINSLKKSEKAKYDRIKGQAKDPQVTQFETPEHLLVRKKDNDVAYEKHLFVDEKGEFLCSLDSSWEIETIEEEISKEDVVVWLRNYDRKAWSLRIPYINSVGKYQPLYPDFIVIRKLENNFIVDILEPHNENLQDNYLKAKGLAYFAEKHWGDFNRIELIRKDSAGLKRLDFTKNSVREQVKTVTNNDHLNTVFEAYYI